MITNIAVRRIMPHPNNPRADVGDVTELALSLQAQGVLQNLTVVPADKERYEKDISSKHAYTGGFIAVIGHRRLAAAKLAGLETVPCAIVDMDEREHLAVMLSENIQRESLTYIEEARGFQMMIDMGESLDSAAKRTGMSRETVRKRVKLLAHDADKLSAALERGATLSELIELDKIKDPVRREKVLEASGTNDFKWALKRELGAEENAEKLLKLVEAAWVFATELSAEQAQSGKYRRISYIYPPNELCAPADADTKDYYFTISNGGVALYVEITSEESNKVAAAEAERARQQERVATLDEVAGRAYELRREFVKNAAVPRANLCVVVEYLLRVLASDTYIRLRSRMLAHVMSLDADAGCSFEALEGALDAPPERSLLCIVYALCGDDGRSTYHSYRGEYAENEDCDALYSCLTALGYELSSEERAYKDGTHELFGGGHE